MLASRAFFVESRLIVEGLATVPIAHLLYSPLSLCHFRQIIPMILDQNYVNLKNQVIKAERRVLKELGFCVHVKHPHKLIVVFLKYLGFDEENNEMLQLAWNYMNDSFRTDVFVRYQPETVACACIALAARKLNINMSTTPPWFVIFKVQEDDLIDACYRIAELYQRGKPNLDQLEAAVDELKKQYQDQRKKEHRNNSSPAVTAVDRNNGSHNMWGGFISRQVPSLPPSNVDEKTEPKQKGSEGGKPANSTKNNNNEKGRSRSSSRPRNSRSRSRSDDRHAKKKDRAKKRTRSRSSPESDYDKKSRKR